MTAGVKRESRVSEADQWEEEITTAQVEGIFH